MERLFSPCTRLHDLLESQGRLEGFQGHREGLQELNLDVSTEELLSAERAFTYADLYAMLGNRNKIVWLTPHAAVARPLPGRGAQSWGELEDSCRLSFSADGKEIVALSRSPEHLLESCDAVLRLLAASAFHSVILNKGDYPRALINAPTLAYLMEQCQSLKILSLNYLEIDENHCRAFGAYSRPGLEIELIHCKLTTAGSNALAEVLLGRNQGPTKLHHCDIEYSVLVNALRENSRLKSLTPRISSGRDVGNQEVLAIAGALKENRGLVYLDLGHGFTMSNETWGAICDSLKTHPTLQILDLRCTGWAPNGPAVVKSWMQALLDMMKMNLSIHTIHLNHWHSKHELFRGSVIPYLETNRLRPRLLAIQKTRPIAYRAKMLGRALLSARTDANSFWMLLSGNPEVAFPCDRENNSSNNTIATQHNDSSNTVPSPLLSLHADMDDNEKHVTNKRRRLIAVGGAPAEGVPAQGNPATVPPQEKSNKELYEMLIEMNTRRKTLQGQAASLQSHTASLQSQIDTMTAGLGSQIETLQGQTAGLESQMASLQSQTASLESQMASLQSQTASLQSQIDTILFKMNRGDSGQTR
jgi:chaperonin cofactor prefoldin